MYTESNYKNYGTTICSFLAMHMKTLMKWSSFGKNMKYQNGLKEKLELE